MVSVGILQKFKSNRDKVYGYHDKVMTKHQSQRPVHTMMITEIMNLDHIAPKQQQDYRKKSTGRRENFLTSK